MYNIKKQISMKTKYLLSPLLAIMILLGYSCNKNTTTTRTKTEKDKFIPWHYSYAQKPVLSNNEVEEIQFYCSEEIKQTRRFSHTTGTPEDGVQKTKVEKTKEIRIINIRQKGEVTHIIRDKNKKILLMLVSFDSEDETFSIWFSRKKDGYFYIYKKYITYKTGEKYQVASDPDCQLLFVFEKTKVKKVIRAEAKGDDIAD